MSSPVPATDLDPDQALAQADDLVERGRTLDALDVLVAANRIRRAPAVERRIVELRHRAFAEIDREAGFPTWPVDGTLARGEGGPVIPQVAPADLTGAVVRDHLMAHGSVHVPGLLDAAQVETCRASIDAGLEARALGAANEFSPDATDYRTLPLPPDAAASLGRPWVAGAGGFLTIDSPRSAFTVLEIFEAVGLRPVLTEYLGERPVLSGNKWTLRRVPTTANADWHQDGAFLGSGIRALNVWVALSDCGVDAPGMDLVPRRFDEVQETGTGGAIFDWAVGPDVVAALSEDAAVVRPRFAAGDALLFDDLFLHRTAVEPTMTLPRDAIEAWFFAPSTYPDGQVPIVW